MLVSTIPQYVLGITNAKLIAPTTAAILYTAPSGADFNSSVVTSIIAHEHSNNSETLRVFIRDANSSDFELFDKTVAGHATEELLTRDLALKEGESLYIEAGTANRLHVVASIQEFAIHRTPQVDL